MVVKGILSLLFLLLAGCSPHEIAPCYEVYGLEEFSAESDLIAREGKFGIMALEGKTFQDLSEDDLKAYKETLTEGDRIQVVLYHPGRQDLVDSIHMVSERIGGFKVEGGEITLPGFEPIYVLGLSLDEAKKKMNGALQSSVRGLEVFLSFKERTSRKVELMGLVRQDSLEVDGKIRLYEVLAKASIAPDANLYASYLIRCGLPLKVDMNRLIREGDMSQNIVMRPGDKIYIANALEKTALVMGEVRRPRPIPLITGSISLREAIALSGGIPFTGDDKHINIIRGDVVEPQIYVLSMDSVLQENNRRLLLIPGDVVYISEKPITRWNIFLTQLQPTLNLILSAQAIYNFTR